MLTKSKKKVSKGTRRNVSKWTQKAMRRDYLENDLLVQINKIEAWRKNKRVMLTIKNPAASKDSNHKYIRVPATDIWGTPGKLFKMKSEED